jgi:hypothetical protein
VTPHPASVAEKLRDDILWNPKETCSRKVSVEGERVSNALGFHEREAGSIYEAEVVSW